MNPIYLFHFLVEDFLHDFAQPLEFGLVLLRSLLLLLIFRKLETLLGDGDQGLSVVLLQLLDSVLVDWIDHVQHLVSPIPQSLDKGRVFDGVLAFAGDEVDRLLVLLHS